MHISRVQIKNFRNFTDVDFSASEHVVLLGANRSGKSNLIHALRLVLDPSIPDAARVLTSDDFPDCLPNPIRDGTVVEVAIEFSDFDSDPRLAAVLGDFLVQPEPPVARVKYRFGPKAGAAGPTYTASQYEVAIVGGSDDNLQEARHVRSRLPLVFLPALRDAEGDLKSWRRSPLRPLLERLEGVIDADELKDIAQRVSVAAGEIASLQPVSNLAGLIAKRAATMTSARSRPEVAFGVAPADPSRLLRSLRLLFDSTARGIESESLGTANVLYLVLRMLDLRHLIEENVYDHVFLAVEEPEAHLHPHVQRLLYQSYLRPMPDHVATHTAILSTHAPNIAAIARFKHLAVLRRGAQSQTTVRAFASLNISEVDIGDLERFIDVNRSDCLFANGVILVEGIAEAYIIPRLCEIHGMPLDSLGVSVCVVDGTNFEPYAKLFGPSGLDIPFVALTDLDPWASPAKRGSARVVALLESIGTGYSGNPEDLPALQEYAIERGIFLNNSTLEWELLSTPHRDAVLSTLATLTSNSAARARIQAANESGRLPDRARFLVDVADVGKGRFAQRLASVLVCTSLPPYIGAALASLCGRVY